MLRFVSLLLLLIFAAPLLAQTRLHPFKSPIPTVAEKRGVFVPEKRAVREIVVFNEVAPFANLPFLQLRMGDQLVRGETVHYFAKSGETRKNLDIFLKRDGHYREISATETDGQRMLTSWEDVAFFDWEPTQFNAEKLWKWSRKANERLTIEQLRRVETALLPEFAEYFSQPWQLFVDYQRFAPQLTEEGIDDEAPIPQPGFLSLVAGDSPEAGSSYLFAGLGFDASTSTFYVFQMQFGRASVVRRQEPILVGPKPVDYIEFGLSRGPNAPRIDVPTGARLARLQAQKVRAQKFQDLVVKMLWP